MGRYQMEYLSMKTQLSILQSKKL